MIGGGGGGGGGMGGVGGGGGMGGVASHHPFTCPFVHNTIGDGMPWLATTPPPPCISIVEPPLS